MLVLENLLASTNAFKASSCSVSVNWRAFSRIWRYLQHKTQKNVFIFNSPCSALWANPFIYTILFKRLCDAAFLKQRTVVEIPHKMSPPHLSTPERASKKDTVCVCVRERLWSMFETQVCIMVTNGYRALRGRHPETCDTSEWAIKWHHWENDISP